MSQFDVVANPFPHSRKRQPFLVALQSDLLERNLEPAGSDTYADRLNPHCVVDGQTFVLITQEMVTVRRSALGPSRGSIAAERDKIIAALDLLFTGF